MDNYHSFGYSFIMIPVGFFLSLCKYPENNHFFKLKELQMFVFVKV